MSYTSVLHGRTQQLRRLQRQPMICFGQVSKFRIYVFYVQQMTYYIPKVLRDFTTAISRHLHLLKI